MQTDGNDVKDLLRKGRWENFSQMFLMCLCFHKLRKAAVSADYSTYLITLLFKEEEKNRIVFRFIG